MRAYQDILHLPGALRFCLTALFARSGGAMMGIGQVLMVSALYGSYTWAGLMAAANGAAWAVGTAILSSLVDKHGQRRVMYPALIVSSAGLAALVVLAVLHVPVWVLLAPAMVAGFFGGSPGAMVRARWNHAAQNARQLHTAYSLESTLDELTFVIGPVVATMLSTQVHPAAGLVAPIVLSLAGGHLFYSQRATEPPLRPASEPKARRSLLSRLILFHPGIGPVVAVNVLVGATFGGIDVTVVATATDWGARGQSGLVLAAFSAGSALAGFFYGSRGWRTPLPTRFTTLIVAFAISTATFLLAPNALVLAALGFICGSTIAPSLINGNALISRLAPPARLTEALAWMGTSLGIGSAVGSSLTGRVLDVAGPAGGFQATMVFSALAALIALASFRALRKSVPD